MLFVTYAPVRISPSVQGDDDEPQQSYPLEGSCRSNPAYLRHSRADRLAKKAFLSHLSFRAQAIRDTAGRPAGRAKVASVNKSDRGIQLLKYFLDVDALRIGNPVMTIKELEPYIMLTL